jgi:hypothetical protein
MSSVPAKEPTPFERFKEFTRRLVAVPKAEIDRQARVYRKRRQADRRKRGKAG